MKVDVDSAVGALNGLVGDYLHRTANGLAIDLTFVVDGSPVPPERVVPAKRMALFVHGLMATEGCWSMFGLNYATKLEADLGLTPLYVRYNSGRHISENGFQLDHLLEALVARVGDAIEELILIGHSMGGLVIRSATHTAAERSAAWLGKVKSAVYIGSPHLGAPLERAGNVLTWFLRKTGTVLADPVTELIGDIIALRSEGIQDLRYGSLHEYDWRDADAHALLQNRRHPVPLLASIRHHLIAGVLPKDPRLAALFGDALVPPRSALGHAQPHDRSPIFPQEHVQVFEGLSHTALLADEAVYQRLREWLS